MFKTASFENEIVKGMEKELFSNQLEKKYSFDKISKAIDFLNSAAEILDDVGLVSEAEAATLILESITKSIKK